MPKIKTHSGAKKRFKLSKNGKPMRGHANKSHILTKKSTLQADQAPCSLQIIRIGSRKKVKLLEVTNHGSY